MALLTPIVKAFITDNGSLQPLHTGLWWPRLHQEWGMEQYVRDNRINAIYEARTPCSRWTCWA